MVSEETRDMLVRLADRYETADFISGDPSWFMHQVGGRRNQEATAFLAQALSYGSRRQFMPRIEWMLDRADGDADRWLRTGRYRCHVADSPAECFYRLYTCRHMRLFLDAYSRLLSEHGSLGEYVAASASASASSSAASSLSSSASVSGLEAVETICRWFSLHGGGSPVIPKDAASACKRICMFLRWMVRSGSPVDLGLWSTFIDRRTLIMPLDTHVVQQSVALGLLSSKSASMSAARRLTATVAQIFPDDPLRADFALFGYGVSGGH